MLVSASANDLEKRKAGCRKWDKASHAVDAELKKELPADVFEMTSEGEARPAWLSLRHHLNGDPRIRVRGASTQPFHGVRAYVSGAYLRVGLLDAKEPVEVIGIATRGGTPE